MFRDTGREVGCNGKKKREIEQLRIHINIFIRSIEALQNIVKPSGFPELLLSNNSLKMGWREKETKQAFIKCLHYFLKII